ncbi:MAG: PTS sugar transporter subunit IIA, partial [Cutibacterium acnes]
MSDLDLSAIDSALLRASEKKSRIATASAMKRLLDPTLFFTGRSFDS